MIHSLSGGVIKDIEYFDFAKVKVTEGILCNNIFWYISPFSNLKQGDIVLVPLGANNTQTKAEVLRVDKNVSGQTAPVPVKRCKKIIKVVK